MTITVPGDRTWALEGLGWPKAERIFGAHPPHVRMIEEVTALRTHPELRPTHPAARGDHARPMGFVLLTFAALTAVATLFV
ncbi:hypothetical protein ACF1AY_38625 [Streptomyces sp. NPDC014776]|uniref:hypothetical protein n=1 Tax=unclassified Streptomyces TaxID=2593676 RepID=UPI0036F6FDD7